MSDGERLPPDGSAAPEPSLARLAGAALGCLLFIGIGIGIAFRLGEEVGWTTWGTVGAALILLASAACGILEFGVIIADGEIRRGSDAPTSDGVEFDRQQKARDSLDRLDGQLLWYCELCESVFSTFDMFYDHRQASDSELARQWATNDDGHDIFAHRRKLDPGEEVPGTVGRAEPCEPTEGPDDV